MTDTQENASPSTLPMIAIDGPAASGKSHGGQTSSPEAGNQRV